MKAYRLSVLLLAFVVLTGASGAAREGFVDLGAGQAAAPPEAELERTRELLNLWKDHVRTVTAERDEALAELEKARSAPAGQFAIETAPLPPALPAGPSREEHLALQRTLENLKAESNTLHIANQRLRADLESARAVQAPQGPSPEELSAARGRISQLEGRIAELEERLRQAPVRNDDELRALKSEIVRAQDTNSKLRSDNEALEARLKTAAAESEASARRFNELQAERDRIAAESASASEKAQAQRAELERRAAAEIDSLRTKLADAEAGAKRVAQLESDLARARADADTAHTAYADLEANWRRYEKENEAKLLLLQTENARIAELERQIAQSARQLEALRTENTQLKPLAAETQTLRAEKTKLEQYVRELKDVQVRHQRQIEELEVHLSTVGVDIEALRKEIGGSFDRYSRKYSRSRG